MVISPCIRDKKEDIMRFFLYSNHNCSHIIVRFRGYYEKIIMGMMGLCAFAVMYGGGDSGCLLYDAQTSAPMGVYERDLESPILDTPCGSSQNTAVYLLRTAAHFPLKLVPL
jgi:hypothetical protein